MKLKVANSNLTILAGFLLVVFLFAGALPAGAQGTRVYLDIDSPTFQKIPLAIAEFHRMGQDKLPADEVLTWFHQELTRLLGITGLFNVIRTKAGLEGRQRAPVDFTRFTEWRIHGAEYLLDGRIQQMGMEVVAEFRLYDLVKGELMVGKRYTGLPEDRQIMVRRFAAEVLALFAGSGVVFNSKIAFVVRKGRKSEILIVDYDGTNLKKLAEADSLILAPRWSPDGQNLAFTSYHGGNPDLYFLPLTGKQEARKIAGFRGINLPGSWSPDGRNLLLTLSIDGNEEIYSLNVENMQLTRLTHHFAIDVSPSFSPDGKRIAFVSARAGSPQIYVMDVEGRNIRRLTFEGNYNTSPSWSPQGNKIAYEGRTQGRFQIFTVDEDGLNPTQVTFEGNNEGPAWSPDGRFLAFAYKRGEKNGIGIINANGTNFRVLHEGADNYISPAWSPVLR